MGEQEHDRQFADELRRLYELAGKPTLAELVRQGQAQRPPVMVSDSSISAWLSGRSVPAKFSAVAFLVSYLAAKAQSGGIGGGGDLSLPNWRRLHDAAWHESHARRGGRPAKTPHRLRDQDRVSARNPVPRESYLLALDEMLASAAPRGTGYVERAFRSHRMDEPESPYGGGGLPVPVSSLLDGLSRNGPLAPVSLLLDESGAGKTTTLQHVARVLARRAQGDTHAPIPILIYLQQYRENLQRLIFEALDEVPELLGNGNSSVVLVKTSFVLLADGLNELGTFRDRFVREILSIRRLRRCEAIVVTCRSADYSNEFGVDHALSLEPLSLRQIERIVVNRFGSNGPSVYGRIVDDGRTLGMARNPMALGMMLDLAADGEFGGNRGVLYKRYVTKILWRERSVEPPGKAVPPALKERTLAALALHMQQHSTLSISAYEAVESIQSILTRWHETIGWRDLVASLEAGGLLTQSNTGYSFRHQSLQEYFAAAALAHAQADAAAGEVISLPSGKEWNEVHLVLAGITPDPSALVQQIMDRDPYLAAKCIVHGAVPDGSCVFDLVSRLGVLARDANWVTRRTCADFLGEMGVQEAIPTLLSLMQDPDREVRWGAVYAVRNIGARTRIVDPSVHDALRRRLDDEFWVICGETALTLAALGYVDAMKDIAGLLGIPQFYIRSCGVEAMAKLGRAGRDTDWEAFHRDVGPEGRLLLQFARTVAVADDGVQAASRGLSDPEPSVRQAAVVYLGHADRFDVADRIGDLLADTDSGVRSLAVWALGRLHAHAYQTHIVAMLHSDTAEIVREMAASALYAMTAVDAVEALIDATNDPSGSVRFGAARSLGRMRAVQARPALRKLAAEDPDVQARLHAVRSLGFIGSNDDLDFLQGLVDAEADQRVKNALAEAVDNVTDGHRSLHL
ncbi:NACHT domain-containing protein [Nocardia brasiliensis]